MATDTLSDLFGSDFAAVHPSTIPGPFAALKRAASKKYGPECVTSWRRDRSVTGAQICVRVAIVSCGSSRTLTEAWAGTKDQAAVWAAQSLGVEIAGGGK